MRRFGFVVRWDGMETRRVREELWVSREELVWVRCEADDPRFQLVRDAKRMHARCRARWREMQGELVRDGMADQKLCAKCTVAVVVVGVCGEHKGPRGRAAMSTECGH